MQRCSVACRTRGKVVRAKVNRVECKVFSLVNKRDAIIVREVWNRLHLDSAAVKTLPYLTTFPPLAFTHGTVTTKSSLRTQPAKSFFSLTYIVLFPSRLIAHRRQMPTKVSSVEHILRVYPHS